MRQPPGRAPAAGSRRALPRTRLGVELALVLAPQLVVLHNQLLALLHPLDHVVDLPGEPSNVMADLLDADGTAIVIHANADDYRTDPTGNAGSRIACGVFEAN